MMHAIFWHGTGETAAFWYGTGETAAPRYKLLKAVFAADCIPLEMAMTLEEAAAASRRRVRTGRGRYV